MQDETSSNEASNKSGVFFVTFNDKAELYKAYMPYISQGGLFVPTEEIYHLGDEVFLLIKLLEEPDKYTVAGKVIWLTPSCAQAGRPTGIGVQFIGEEAIKIREKIETYLAGSSDSDRFTDTL